MGRGTEKDVILVHTLAALRRQVGWQAQCTPVLCRYTQGKARDSLPGDGDVGKDEIQLAALIQATSSSGTCSEDGVQLTLPCIRCYS